MRTHVHIDICRKEKERKGKKRKEKKRKEKKRKEKKRKEKKRKEHMDFRRAQFLHTILAIWGETQEDVQGATTPYQSVLKKDHLEDTQGGGDPPVEFSLHAISTHAHESARARASSKVEFD